MKRITLILAALTLGVLFIGAVPQQKEKDLTNRERHARVMAVMHDPATMNMMMNAIAANSRYRMNMMQMMLNYGQQDSTTMYRLCRTFLNNNAAHSMMMGMMGSGMYGHGMMGRGMMGYGTETR